MKHTNVKKFFAAIVAVILMMTVTIPAMAAGEYKITLVPAEFTNVEKEYEDRFEAYQIFGGDINPTPNDEEHPRNDDQLANIQWGTGIDDSAQLLLDLQSDPTIGTKFASAKTAKDVANVLSEFAETDDPNVRIFAKIAGKHLSVASGKSKIEGNNFVIENLDPGYYIVKDTYGNEPYGDKYDAVSPYILDVFNNKTINLKSKAPDVEKDIVKADGTVGKYDDYEIGQDITFRLTGTLPENYDMFEKYSYKFKDTLSKGLTFNEGSVTVKVKNDPTEATISADKYSVKNPAENTNVLEIAFEDLKAADLTEYGIKYGSEIIVEYTAKLNVAANINDINENSVVLEFSNDPYGEGTGETVEKKVNVYTFGIGVTKISSEVKEVGTGEESPEIALDGVGFKLYKTVDGTKKYAQLSKTDDYGYKVTNWVNDIADATEMLTENGGKLNVGGLDQGDYFLTETTTLPGFDTMKDIEFTIKAEYNDETNTLKSVTVTEKGETDRDDVIVSGSDTNMKLVNEVASILPGTGGMGTYVFYIIGGVILAAAIVLLIITKKKGSVQKQ